MCEGMEERGREEMEKGKESKCNTHEFCGVEFEGGKEKGGREGGRQERKERNN